MKLLVNIFYWASLIFGGGTSIGALGVFAVDKSHPVLVLIVILWGCSFMWLGDGLKDLYR